MYWRPDAAIAANPDWRPYYDMGQWVQTDNGLFWQSDYTWGDIPFHYGRWVLNPVWAGSGRRIIRGVRPGFFGAMRKGTRPSVGRLCRWERFLWMGCLCLTESGWALILILAWAKPVLCLSVTIISMKGSSG